MEPKIMKAYCPISHKYFIFSIVDGKAVDFIPIDKARYDALNTTDSVSETARNLQGNWFEQNRKIASSSRVKSHYRCETMNKYNFQCAYCDHLIVDRGYSGKSLEECKIAVTTPCYDDIGAVLTDMRLRHHQYGQSLNDLDIVFINCGTGDNVNPHALRNFVEKGGVAYLSDWAISVLEEAFPDMVLEYSKDTEEMTVRARVEDQEIARIIGQYVNIQFDLGNWVKIESCNATTLLSADIDGMRTPIMIMEKYKEGTVFYTSFHNHAIVTQQESNLLKLFICKQLGTKTGQSVNDIQMLLGLNIKL